MKSIYCAYHSPSNFPAMNLSQWCFFQIMKVRMPGFFLGIFNWHFQVAIILLYRWVPLYSNVLNWKLRFVRTVLKITLLSLMCWSACFVQNSVHSKEFYLVFRFRINRDPPGWERPGLSDANPEPEVIPGTQRKHTCTRATCFSVQTTSGGSHNFSERPHKYDWNTSDSFLVTQEISEVTMLSLVVLSCLLFGSQGFRISPQPVIIGKVLAVWIS